MCKDKTFLRYKIGRLFDLLDFDKNGTIEKKDLIGWGTKHMEGLAAVGQEVTDEHREKVKQLYGPMYNMFTLYGIMGKNKKRFVSFVSTMSQMPGFKMISYRIFKKPFLLFDIDNSGDYSLEEFVHGYLGPLGISEEEAKESFKILDTDGNGVLDFKEFTNGVIHYLSDLEENKWSNTIGLVKYNPDKWEEEGSKEASA